MEDKELTESISKAMDFNLSQIFNEIDLKVKNITHTKASAINLIPAKKQETKILVYSEVNSSEINSKIILSFTKENAMKMVDLIKGAEFGTTKSLSSIETNALQSVSENLFKAYVNSLNSVAKTQLELSSLNVFFSFSAFENEFLSENISGQGRFFELEVTVGGTQIKGEMKFFAPIQMIK